MGPSDCVASTASAKQIRAAIRAPDPIEDLGTAGGNVTRGRVVR